MTYDALLDKVVAVAAGASGAVETWTYAGGVFTNVSTNETPPTFGPVYFDAALGSPLLLDDHTDPLSVWQLVDGNWSQLATGPRAPDPGTSVPWAAAYDTLDQELVFVDQGGFTWTLTGSNWTNLSVTQHAQVIGSVDGGPINMAYDSTDQVVVLFGGTTEQGQVSAGSATWIFTGGNWTELCSECGPSSSWPFAVADDPGQDGLIVFGVNGSTYGNATWLYVSGAWDLVPGGPSPSPRIDSGFVYDVRDGYDLLSGGYDPSFPWSPYAQTWWWGGPSLTLYSIHFYVAPSHGAMVRWDGRSFANGSYVNVTDGEYAVAFWPLGPAGAAPPQSLAWYRIVNSSVTPGLSELGPDVYVNGSGGALFLNVTPYPIVNVESQGCGPVTLNGTAEPSGSQVNLANRSLAYPLNATRCSAAEFLRWDASGGVTVANATDPNTSALVRANGTVSALYQEIGPGPVVQNFTVTPSHASLGSIFHFRVNITGGAPPYAYAFEELPDGCRSNDTPDLACVPTQVGRYFVTVSVTDALGGSVSSVVVLTVSPVIGTLVVGAFLADHAPLLVGQSTLLSVYLVGGAPPFQFYYTGLPPGCKSRDTGNLSCVPSSVGGFEITVLVADADGHETSGSLLLTVGPSGSWIQSAAGDPLVWVGASLVAGGVSGTAVGWIWRGRRPGSKPGTT